MKDRNGNASTYASSVMGRWKEYFEELMNEDNERGKNRRRGDLCGPVMRRALKRMKSEEVVGPDDIPVDVWKCRGEVAVEFLT